jgi:hypothetical protein
MSGEIMFDQFDEERAVSRRRFLAMGGAIAAAGTVGSWADPLSALGATAWPKGHLSARDAARVKESQFMPVGQFRSWNAALHKIGPGNQRGLRATGGAAHEGYVDELIDDLQRAGAKQVHTEAVPMRRWTADKWSLNILTGSGAGAVKTASYLPYSGRTPAAGVTGELVYVDASSTPAPGSLKGKIAAFDVPLTIIPYSFFASLGYAGANYDPQHVTNPSAPYKRPYLNGVVGVLEKLQAAGAAGAVAVLDYPYAAAHRSYFPYDGIIRAVPGIYLDRAAGAKVKAQANAGGITARLSLPAAVKQVNSRNIIGFIQGRSSELVTLHCHSDGSNAIEDNGPGAIVAISRYLARLPRNALPHTIMILLTTGHFAGGNGARAFRKRHKNDLVERSNAAITIEHLGLREWNELSPGKMGFTGRYESGAIFAPGSKALVGASFIALKRAKAAPAEVLKPLSPNASGVADNPAWPGEGQYLFARGGMPDANYITGPTYLLNWGIKTLDRANHNRVRAEAIAFTEMILRLGRTPRSKLRTYTL